MENELVSNLSKSNEFFEIIKNPDKLAEFIGGLLTADKSEYKLSAVRMVGASLKWELLTQIGKEIKYYQQKGEIKTDFLNEEINRMSFKELLQVVDNEIPDDKKFEAIKSLFFVIVNNQSKMSDKILSYEFMRIIKKLNSGEIVVLITNYEIYNNKKIETTRDAGAWLKMIAKQIGHNMGSLVELHENKLIELHLITGRLYPDRSGIKEENHRLTELGIKLCEYIEKYPNLL